MVWAKSCKLLLKSKEEGQLLSLSTSGIIIAFKQRACIWIQQDHYYVIHSTPQTTIQKSKLKVEIINFLCCMTLSMRVATNFYKIVRCIINLITSLYNVVIIHYTTWTAAIVTPVVTCSNIDSMSTGESIVSVKITIPDTHVKVMPVTSCTKV